MNVGPPPGFVQRIGYGHIRATWPMGLGNLPTLSGAFQVPKPLVPDSEAFPHGFGTRLGHIRALRLLRLYLTTGGIIAYGRCVWKRDREPQRFRRFFTGQGWKAPL
jgi:hypothetical protein